ncbi:hypothetical protein [Desulfitobacterium chlororespirans]|uniref:Uncharacterized protein n=1 Tax=Desulfitobacterium chlororespirans DSM 11544 TaxID=1121395 RepID=A0A1M7U2M1_9FIRM|nr:hypothetical protein [Desulfitobacterium chlororespirans]SHN77144.1 hypothetical protein SAMN02745215_02847 [Desulfitobacterium chlororespirans DSM 11544]
MAYPAYTVRVLARAIITKVDMGDGTAEELVVVYPPEDQQPILDQVYVFRPDLKPVEEI